MYLVRHAPTEANSGQQMVRGQMDVPPDEKGKKIADLRARWFMDLPVRQIRTSPDQRSMEMARDIQKYSGAPIEPDYRLHSWDQGDIQGQQLTPAVKARIYEYMTTKAREAPPGGEPYAFFLARVIPYIRQAVDQEELVCVTHFAVIRAVMAWDAAGREGIAQDPAMLRRDSFIDQLQVTLITPTECTPLIQQDMRTIPEAR